MHLARMDQERDQVKARFADGRSSVQAEVMAGRASARVAACALFQQNIIHLSSYSIQQARAFSRAQTLELEF